MSSSSASVPSAGWWQAGCAKPEHVIVVDRADDLAAQASDLGYLVVQGDAGVDDAVLDRSGIERAKALVVTTEDPDRKLSITLLAHSINPTLRIAVTGAGSPGAELLRRAGASEVVITDDLIADALVDRLGKDGARSRRLIGSAAGDRALAPVRRAAKVGAGRRG